jgi:pimeloyl-ACP methyl ester carboxylesterase/DNA-binding CsgD family transcriptional regulator
MNREMHFCLTEDGVRIAYTPPSGVGRPLLAVTGWACNAEYELRHSTAESFYDALAQGRPIAWVVPRGIGASQRDIPALTLESLVSDIEAVADQLDWQSFDLWGEWSGNLAVMAYAAKHPEKVGRIVLWSASANWGFLKPGTVKALSGMIRTRWWLARRTMGDLAFPTGPVELFDWYVELMGESLAPDMAVRYLEFQERIDITNLLPKVKAPVLLLHRRGDRVTPIAAGRAMAGLLPNSRFIALDGDIAYPYLGDTSYIETARQFLDEGAVAARRPDGMTAREVEVLRLIAAGRSNRQIADELAISVNTADRHVSNILTKIAASNRAEAASFAVRNGLAE